MYKYLQKLDYNFGESLYEAALDLKDNPKYFEYMLEEFGEEFDDFETASNAIPEMYEAVHAITFYKDGGKNYIQLSDERMDFSGIKVPDDKIGELSSGMRIYLEDACAKFEAQTGIEVFLLGRSGRHVCVANNFSNAINLEELKEIQQKIQKEYIKDVEDCAKSLN